MLFDVANGTNNGTGGESSSKNFTFTLEELNYNMTMAVLPVTVLIGIETVVGLVGNILILITYSKRYERSNFRYFVLCMAVLDLTSCLTTLPGEIFSQLNWFTYEYGWVCKVKSYFNVLTAWGSAATLLLLAFDRHRKICHPLRWQIQPSLARRLCMVFVAIAAMVAVPITILWGKQSYEYHHNGGKVNVSICEKSDKYADDIYPFVYIGCVYILPIGSMVIVICVLNFLTAKKLFCGKKPDYRHNGTLGCRIASGSSIATSKLGTVSSTISLTTSTTSNKSHTSVSESFVQSETTTQENGTFRFSNSADSNSKSTDITGYDRRLPTSVSFISLRDIPDTESNLDHLGENSTDYDIDTSIEISRNGCQTSVTPNRSMDDLRQRDSRDLRLKRKTIIMLILTSVFVVTMGMYVILLSLVAETDGVLRSTTNSEKAVFFFFWRLYFINCIINPLLYGFLDSRFRSGLKNILTGK